MMRLNDEIKSIEIFTRNIEDEIIKQRVEQVLEWNIKKATKNKFAFFAFSIIILILNASIPIINQLNGITIIVTIISSITTVLTGIMTLINFKDVWCRYRTTAEKIKQECIFFNCKYGEYKGEDREEKFIANFEKLILEDRDLWINSRFKFENDNNVEE